MGFSEIIKNNILVERAYDWKKHLSNRTSLKEETKRILEKEWLILSRDNTETGIFSNLIVWLPFLAITDNKDINLSVDLTSNNLGYDGNLWDAFFERLSNYENPDKKDTGKVIYSKTIELHYDEFQWVKLPDYSAKKVKMLGEILNKHVKLNESMEERLNKEYEELFAPVIRQGKKILAVKFRGTDYNVQKPVNHPIQPSITQALYETDKLADKYEYIYLSTEDEEIYNAYLNKYGDRLLCRKHSRFAASDLDMSKKWIRDVALTNRGIESEREYILDVYLASKADAFLTSLNSGSAMCVLLNGGNFDKVYWMLNGFYK